MEHKQARTTEHQECTKLIWVEPAVEKLDVRETSGQPTVGGDNNVGSQFGNYPDCTLS